MTNLAALGAPPEPSNQHNSGTSFSGRGVRAAAQHPVGAAIRVKIALPTVGVAFRMELLVLGKRQAKRSS